ncbi:MAG: NAD(P)-dependent oxidoreductase [Dehalococcoidia bacterium]|nr:NAD(P)-dependent oxidoreductase [Dehalococcoidia bacterium]
MTPEEAATRIDRKARLQIPPQPMPKLPPEERVRGWMESYLPLAPEVAKLEALRCIQCPAAPCMDACPVHNDIPGAFLKLEAGDILGGAAVFQETSNLPDMCGRLCPQERLCEGSCVVGKKNLPVAIGRLEAFLADYAAEHGGLPVCAGADSGKRVAVIGAGPAGLVVAEELRKLGHAVTVYDAWPQPGGVLLYGIPNFKMDKAVLDRKIAALTTLGVSFRMGVEVGRDVSIDDLFGQGYHAVFLGHGAGKGVRIGVPGEDLPGVMSATEFLVRGNLPPQMLPESMRAPLDPGRRVVVIGGGDTSMDCVRTAVRLRTDEVLCVYRRTESEMPGRAEERKNAKEEGVQFHFLANPLRFEAAEDGSVGRVICQRMELGEADAQGRRRPVGVEGSDFAIEADTVIIAAGYDGDDLITSTAGIETHGRSLVVVDQNGATGRAGVFAGGDNVNGADLVVTAMASARQAVPAIHAYLCS